MRYDLNLLKAFDCLYQERSVSRAAQRMHVSQSAMSAQLSKLRLLFKDPLFTREKYGILPTEKSHRIAKEINLAINRMEALVLEEQVFDPASATDTFVIAANDYFEALILPKVFETLNQSAPNCKIRIVEFNQHVNESGMMMGNIHLGFGRISAPPDNVVQQRVMVDSFDCLVGADNEQCGQHMTLKSFQTLSHVVVKPAGKLTTGVFSVLSEIGVQRNVKCEVTHFHYIPGILTESDLVATVPSRIAEHLASNYPLKILPTPHDFGTFPFHLVWHQRYQKDPAHQWLRDTVRQCCDEFPQKKAC